MGLEYLTAKIYYAESKSITLWSTSSIWSFVRILGIQFMAKATLASSPTQWNFVTNPNGK
jgi:hypothetical protein